MPIRKGRKKVRNATTKKRVNCRKLIALATWKPLCSRRVKELQEFRKNSSQQINGTKEDIGRIYERIEEAEEWINIAETWIQSSEDILSELVKLCEAKLTDLAVRWKMTKPGKHKLQERLQGMAPGFLSTRHLISNISIFFHCQEEETFPLHSHSIRVRRPLKRPSFWKSVL